MQGDYYHVSNELSRKALIEAIKNQPLGFDVKIQKSKKENRTLTQNAALHKYCDLLAQALNDAGLDMRVVIKDEVDIPWTMENVKNHLWRPVYKVVTQEHSTTKADTTQYSEVYNVLSRHLSQKFGGIFVPWPSKRG